MKSFRNLNSKTGKLGGVIGVRDNNKSNTAYLEDLNESILFECHNASIAVKEILGITLDENEKPQLSKKAYIAAAELSKNTKHEGITKIFTANKVNRNFTQGITLALCTCFYKFANDSIFPKDHRFNKAIFGSWLKSLNLTVGGTAINIDNLLTQIKGSNLKINFDENTKMYTMGKLERPGSLFTRSSEYNEVHFSSDILVTKTRPKLGKERVVLFDEARLNVNSAEDLAPQLFPTLMVLEALPVESIYNKMTVWAVSQGRWVNYSILERDSKFIIHANTKDYIENRVSIINRYGKKPLQINIVMEAQLLTLEEKTTLINEYKEVKLTFLEKGNLRRPEQVVNYFSPPSELINPRFAMELASNQNNQPALAQLSCDILNKKRLDDEDHCYFIRAIKIWIVTEDQAHINIAKAILSGYIKSPEAIAEFTNAIAEGQITNLQAIETFVDYLLKYDHYNISILENFSRWLANATLESNSLKQKINSLLIHIDSFFIKHSNRKDIDYHFQFEANYNTSYERIIDGFDFPNEKKQNYYFAKLYNKTIIDNVSQYQITNCNTFEEIIAGFNFNNKDIKDQIIARLMQLCQLVGDHDVLSLQDQSLLKNKAVEYTFETRIQDLIHSLNNPIITLLRTFMQYDHFDGYAMHVEAMCIKYNIWIQSQEILVGCAKMLKEYYTAQKIGMAPLGMMLRLLSKNHLNQHQALEVLSPLFAENLASFSIGFTDKLEFDPLMRPIQL